MSLNDRCCWLDVWAVERLSSQSPDLAHSDGDTIFRAADRLLGMYRGDFLKGEDIPPWAMPQRARLRNRFLRSLGQLALGLEQQDDHDRAIDIYLRGVEVDETAEALYQGLMTSYLKRGRRAEALATYERCEEMLSSLLGTRPSPRTESIRDMLSS